MHTVVAEMKEEKLLEERAEVLQRLEDLEKGRTDEGSLSESRLRISRIDKALRRLGPQQLELEL